MSRLVRSWMPILREVSLNKYFIICISILALGCETTQEGSKVIRAVNLGPDSCDVDVIANWIRTIADESDAYGHYDDEDSVNIIEVERGWKVYIQRIDNARLLPGGSPTAILERDTCKVLERYLTQ